MRAPGVKVIHRLDTGRARLSKLVAASHEAPPRLPLVHSTDSFTFEDILSSGRITPQGCTVFTGESLIYFFYGRPAFRPNSDAEPSSLQHYFPVCLIFKPDISIAISRVFPFDSGAFHNGMYAAYVHSKMKLGDFRLDADPTTPGRFVNQFFGSTPGYLIGKPTTPQKVDPSEFEAQSILGLIQSKGANDLDGRIASVEVQTSTEVEIKGAVAAVVLTSGFADTITGKTLKRLHIDVLPYRTFERSKPDDYTTPIANICLDYYVRTRLLKKGEI